MLLRVRKLLWLVFLMMSFTSYGQQYSVLNIKSKTDSIVRSLVGERIFKYSVYDGNGYYSYKQGNDTAWAMLKDNSETKNKVTEVFVSYNVNYHYPICALYDSVTGIITLEMDSRLQLVNEPDISFIPDPMLRYEDCHLMSKEDAIAIAKTDNHLDKRSDLNASIKYNAEKKRFIWNVNCFVKGQLPYIDHTQKLQYMWGSKMEYTDIDAETKEIIEEDTFPSDKNPLDMRNK